MHVNFCLLVYLLLLLAHKTTNKIQQYRTTDENPTESRNLGI